MAAVTQRTVTQAVSQLWGATSSGGSITVINLDTAHTAYIGYASTITPGQPTSFPLGPLASAVFDGTQTCYAVADSGVKLTVGLIPGGGSYSPGSLAISGPVTAEITGPVTVEGTVDIGNTPAVTISGTPTVTVSGTPTVDIGNTPSVTATISGTPTVDINSGNVTATISGTPTVGITGTADVQVQNATIDVTGSGGFILPGQLALLVKNSGTLAAGAGSSSQLGGVSYNVSTYNSILFLANSPTTSSTATGASVCAHWFFQWTDAAGNIIEQDSVSCLLGSEFCVQVPVKGSQLNVFLFNTGTTGTISYPAGSVLLWGDYRTVTDITVMSYGISSLPAITGWSLIQPSAPVLSIPQWIAALDESSETANTAWLLPLPLWNGPVSGWYQQVTEALANNATIVDLTYAVQGSIPAGTGYSFGILQSLPSAAAVSLMTVSYYSPPTQLAFLFKAGGTSGGQTELYLTGGT